MSTPTDETTVEFSRAFEASAERIFDAWLNREEWQAWIGPEGLNCDVPLLEPRVGGQYRITMRLTSGDVVPVAGVFKIIDAPRILAFTWGREGDTSRHSVVTITLRADGKRTELTLRQEGLASAASRDDHTKGWNSTLNKLAYFLR
jgi:uncharacterized protein YndB with AHSA1/START domain